MAIKRSKANAEESEAIPEHPEQTEFSLTSAGIGPSILLQGQLGST